jgi:cystathionine beta-synthase
MALHDVTSAVPDLQVHDNIITTIGDTPLVRLHSVAADIACPVYAKVEFFNPGGSIKDRIGPAIIKDAEERGVLKPGGTIVEATSGNTGVGLAIAAAVKGYRCIFVMPDKMSQEKIQLLRAFGARVVVTPTAVEPEDPRSYYSVADRLVAETPGAILANQYHNPVNPRAHYETTGPELWRQTEGKIRHFVAGMGTGGTITGVGRFFKEQNPRIQIVGVDPVGSILYDLHRSGSHGQAESYKVEGIGEDFLPSTTDLSVIDTVVKVNDRESFLMTRRIVREEGMFVGGSCGSAVAGALKYARERNLGPDDLMVVVLPDTGARYLSKVFDDDWMRENGFLEPDWVDYRANDVLQAKSHKELLTAAPDDSQMAVIARFKEHGISQMPVLDEEGRLVGMVRELALLQHMLSSEHEHTADETIREMIDPNVVTVRPDTALETLMSIFSDARVVVVTSGEGVLGILTQIDILDFLAGRLRQ